MNLANSTMKKNFVPIVDFCESPWAFVRLLLLFVSIAATLTILFEVRSVRRSHNIGTLLVRVKPPVILVMKIFLWGQMVGMIFIRKSIPFSAKFFVSIFFQSFDYGILDLV